jgi:hypothetical protein
MTFLIASYAVGRTTLCFFSLGISVGGATSSGGKFNTGSMASRRLCPRGPRGLGPLRPIYPERRGEIYWLAFNPQHRWLYFPDMEVEELVFIKCYDSLNDGRARFSAHSAFDDPTCPPGSPPRQSIEVRTLVLW